MQIDKILSRKVAMGCAALHPSWVFSWFQGVPEDMKYCYEKFPREVAKGWLFSWFQGVPKGREILLRKVAVGCATLNPPYRSFRSFRVSQRDMKSCLIHLRRPIL